MGSRTAGLALPAVLMLAACYGEAPSADVTSRAATSTTASIPEVVRPEGSVLVKVTGSVQVGAGGIQEICAGQDETCAGIALAGNVDAPDTDPAMLQVTGWYDGAQLLVVDSEIPDPLPFADSDFSTPCKGLQGKTSVNPPDDPMNAVAAYTETIPDRFAGIIGHDFQSRLFDVIDLEQTATWGSSVGVLTNRVEVMMEYLDGDLRSRIESEFGTAVEIFAFIEILDGTIADLPDQKPVRPGDVELPTQPNRAGGGMEALGTFELRFDADLGCVYFPGDESDAGSNGRTVPVWPFGYTAASNPLRIYDQDGVLVAREGDVIQMGGGFVEYVTDQELCGASGAWIMSSRPVVIEP